MNELQVTVKQTPGTITWNFDELMLAVKEEMKRYEAIVYDDTAIKTAKADIATLRKLRKAVEDRRLEIRKTCLEPYGVIEAQAKQLVELIDKPIDTIAKQITEYEEEQKKQRKDEILAYMNEAFGVLPGDVANKLRFKVYDTKWENASATKKSWKQAIDDAVTATQGDLNILNGIDEDFRDAAMQVYMKNLTLSEAMLKAQELENQKKIILENERRRQEEERQRKEMQERLRREAEEKAAREAERLSATPAPTIPKPEVTEQQADAIPKTEGVQHTKPQMSGEPEQDGGGAVRIIRFFGSEEQYRKVLAYIKFVGARYEA